MDVVSSNSKMRVLLPLISKKRGVAFIIVVYWQGKECVSHLWCNQQEKGAIVV